MQSIRVPRPTTVASPSATPAWSRDLIIFIAFIAPNVVTLCVFSYWPMIRNLWLSFTYWDMIAPEPLWIVGRNVVRAAMFAPAILPGSAIALVWTFLLAPYYGLISQAATGLGMPMTRWQNDPVWAMPTVILVVIWKTTGYDAVIFLAGLQGIPRELYEAARVDGANAWQRFVNV
ncbi:MAG: sugar ABC transporter permease, partial [Chloroflexi bacterium]|nr:sugar ABC transporter permease [Chloroflexota bacterium]